MIKIPLIPINIQSPFPIGDPEEFKKSNVWGNIKEKTFIETGTFFGHGVLSAIKKGCTDIHSIEINSEIFQSACIKMVLLGHINSNDSSCEIYKKDDFFSIVIADAIRVSLYNGNTINKLPLVLSRIKEKSCFWLDAHWSGEVTQIGGILEKKSKNHVKVPILQELEIINKHHIKDHTIMIDDYNQVCDHVNGGYSKIKKNIKKINKDYKIEKVKKEDQEDYIIIAKS